MLAAFAMHYPTLQILVLLSRLSSTSLLLAQDLGWGIENVVQGALGEGIMENITDSYNFIMNNYQPGDKLFFFGFS